VKRRGPVLVVDNDAARRVEDVGMVAVCVASLEGLGRIVGRYGSEAAGVALRDYVQRLRSVLRDGDQLIQINESKYCLLLKDLYDENHALLAGQKLERAFGAPLWYRDSPIRLELRAGIASGHGVHGDAERLFRAAEAARETAVVQRCVWVVGTAAEADAAQRGWQLADEVEAAIENHDLRLHYQPHVRATDGRADGAEGLIRWHHGDELLTPQQFLPHLDAHAMAAITGHVIRRCVSDLLALPEVPWVSVNVTAGQLLDPVLRQTVVEELSLWNVDPGRLVLEIAEAGLMEYARELVPGLRELQNHGVRILLDDCGGGATELGRFRDLPIDGIKLDRRLTANLPEDPFAAYVARMLVEFGHFLGLEVVAKGVESLVLAEQLKGLGCDLLQGFAISPPLPLQAFGEWLRMREVTPGS
jgi:EAL domain-containing protein (putative c-di-GMP-specific phosphodiesterase class I)/GGDEF domain-containing protein